MLAFIIWRTINGVKKGKVIADLYILNYAIIFNIYPLPLLNFIIFYLINKKYITIIHIKLLFY